jgi:hypothetical protein
MVELEQTLANRSWLWRRGPFPHVVARDVFTAAFYKLLSDQLVEVLDRGLSDTPKEGSFSRTMPGYDSYGIGFSHATRYPAALFVSSQWRDLMCNLFDVGPTPYIYAGAHHHAVHSHNGFIHNDFNPAWFPRCDPGQLQCPNNALCSYRTGLGILQPNEQVEVVRGVALIFYLLNGEWRAGDGGETALYATSNADVADPIVSVPPIDNSLVAFECTPTSFHTFLSNTRQTRTSIIVWTHRTMEEVSNRLDITRLERWKL